MKWKEFKDTIEKKYGVTADTEIRWIDCDTYATGETLASELEVKRYPDGSISIG